MGDGIAFLQAFTSMLDDIDGRVVIVTHQVQHESVSPGPIGSSAAREIHAALLRLQRSGPLGLA